MSATIFKLSYRLQSALELVPEGANVIDVGADRGQFSICLSQLGHQVLAIENKNGPYSSLEENVKKENNPLLKCHLSDGIDYLPKEIDTCCILGMGGATIFDILSAHKEAFKQLKTIIIEPQSFVAPPLGLLLDHGYINDAGEYVYEKRYYPLLRFVQKDQKIEYSRVERKYGPYPVKQKDPLLIQYLEKEINRYSRIDNQEAKNKQLEYETDLKEILAK